MITSSDSRTTLDCGKFFVVVPIEKYYKKYLDLYPSYKKVPFGFNYSSGNNNHFLSVEEIRDLIKENIDPNFLNPFNSTLKLKDFIPYGKQNIDQNDINEVVDVLKSDFLTQGPLVEVFESKICEKLSPKYAIAVNSATSALHIACMALDINENDTVWTSPNSFVASANCALYCGAKVDFVDIDLETGLISIEKLSNKLEQASILKNYLRYLYPYICVVLVVRWKQLKSCHSNMVLRS